MTRTLDPRHVWNVIYNVWSMISNTNVTQYCSCNEKLVSGKPLLRLPRKMKLELTKCCACHDKWHLTLLFLDDSNTWRFYYLTILLLDDSISCRCYYLTLLVLDDSSDWLIDDSVASLTILLFNAVLLDESFILDDSNTWRFYNLTILVLDDSITWLTLLLLDDSMTWLCYFLTLVWLDSAITGRFDQ